MKTDENIDTSLSLHMSKHDAAAFWKEWTERRSVHMLPLHVAGLAGPENIEWNNVVEHSLIVNATALFIAQKLLDNGVDVDISIVDQASLLHDVTKRIEREAGVSYDNEHESSLKRDFLNRFGYSDAVIDGTLYTGRVEDMFIEDGGQRADTLNARPLEWLIVGYADARTRNTDIVSLARARELNKQKVPKDASVYDIWYDFYVVIEERLFKLMQGDISPDGVTNDAIAAMVAGHTEARSIT